MRLSRPLTKQQKTLCDWLEKDIWTKWIGPAPLIVATSRVFFSAASSLRTVASIAAAPLAMSPLPADLVLLHHLLLRLLLSEFVRITLQFLLRLLLVLLLAAAASPVASYSYTPRR